jgi:hypothetical protein
MQRGSVSPSAATFDSDRHAGTMSPGGESRPRVGRLREGVLRAPVFVLRAPGPKARHALIRGPPGWRALHVCDPFLDEEVQGRRARRAKSQEPVPLPQHPLMH